MSNNLMEDLLRKLINDPSLLKTIEKMATESVKQGLREKKKIREHERFGSFDYVNLVQAECKLCKTTTDCYQPMVWDKIDKLHRTGGMFRELLPAWSSLDLRKISVRTPTCDCCKDALLAQSKEDLIRKLIILSNRL